MLVETFRFQLTSSNLVRMIRITSCIVSACSHGTSKQEMFLIMLNVFSGKNKKPPKNGHKRLDHREHHNQRVEELRCHHNLAWIRLSLEDGWHREREAHRGNHEAMVTLNQGQPCVGAPGHSVQKPFWATRAERPDGKSNRPVLIAEKIYCLSRRGKEEGMRGVIKHDEIRIKEFWY